MVASWGRRAGRGDAEDSLLIRARHRDGRLVWTQLWAQVISDSDGRPTIIGHAVDVTDEQRLRRHLEHAQRMEAVSALAAGVAHEFNNMLQAILGNAQLTDALANPASPDHPRLNRIASETHRGAKLAQQLLAFSRQAPLQPSPLDVNDALRQLAELLGRTLHSEIHLECALADDLWPIVGDRGHLQQVALSLALNARDAMPDGGILRLETSNILADEAGPVRHAAYHGRQVLLRVSDTGVGMDEETLTRAFEPSLRPRLRGRAQAWGWRSFTA